jgi:alkanesulfonate monooxygenase SsuD/methylene tetrahydromethanopterin reductase-like flavin-dependent oxidoreductase (luciferase family)
MKVGLSIPTLETWGPLRSWAELASLVQDAERAGLDAVWISDHLIMHADDGEKGTYEGWTLMSALAAATERITIGSLVMCAPLRNPALMAKMAATFDAIAPRRLVLGVGAGWHDPEFEAYGFPTDHKVGRFEEWIEILVRLLRGERFSFEGRYYTLRDAALVPPPQHRIPILIGSMRPRMHGLAARWADTWSLMGWFGAPDERIDEHVERFEEAVRTVGRDPESLPRVAGVVVRDPGQPFTAPQNSRWTDVFDGSLDGLAELIDDYRARGFAELIVKVQPTTGRSVERLAEAAQLASAGRRA